MPHAPDAKSRLPFARALALASGLMVMLFGARPAPRHGTLTPSPEPEPPPPPTPHPTPYYAAEEIDPMTTPKKNAKPLTQRAWEALHKHGPATTDAVARRSGATAKATSKALAALKARGLTTFRRTKKGENVHSAKGKAWPTK